ncbi:MAG TPA: hypothetical protein VJI98_05840 [Candidatus Nanoarchaeia archaeon]|nr:hypothetical protein [Candidatus Nanoarchaeia archaeon]
MKILEQETEKVYRVSTKENGLVKLVRIWKPSERAYLQITGLPRIQYERLIFQDGNAERIERYSEKPVKLIPLITRDLLLGYLNRYYLHFQEIVEQAQGLQKYRESHLTDLEMFARIKDRPVVTAVLRRLDRR